MKEFNTIKENCEVQIVEKKSRFIAKIYQIESKEEAEEILKRIKKQFYDAKHHCFGYRVIERETILERCSDDGEPSGTAGSPILTIMKNKELCNILVIVIRYFGGILLGTGGLVRAYSQATIQAIEKAECVEKELGKECQIILNYSEIEAFKYYCKHHHIKIIKEEYFDQVYFFIEITDKKWEELNSNTDNLGFKMIKKEEKRKKYISKNSQI